MINIDWGNVTEGILIAAGGGSLLLILGYIGWTWKRSIYGRMELYREELKEEMKGFRSELQTQITNDRHNFQASLQLMTEMIKGETLKITNSISNVYSKKQDSTLCDALRVGCAGRIVEKMHSYEQGLADVKDHFDGQIAQVMEGLTGVGDRMDRLMEIIAGGKK